jgi:hypothetical protein
MHSTHEMWNECVESGEQVKRPVCCHCKYIALESARLKQFIGSAARGPQLSGMLFFFFFSYNVHKNICHALLERTGTTVVALIQTESL